MHGAHWHCARQERTDFSAPHGQSPFATSQAAVAQTAVGHHMRAGVGNILLMDHKPERSKAGGGVGNPEKKEHRDQPAMGFLCT